MPAKAEKKKKLNKSQRKYIISIVVMIAVIAFTVYTLFSQSDAAEVITTLSDAKTIFVLLLVAIELAAFALEGLVIRIFTSLYRRKYHWYEGILNAYIGSFFSAITPFSSGGQFAQIYTFSQQGVRAADAGSVLVMMFIVSQITLILYGTLAMIFGYNSTVGLMENIRIGNINFSPIGISILGFCINVWTLLFLVFMAYSRHFHHFVLNVVVGIGAKLHLIKDPQRKRAELVAQTTTFRVEMHLLLENWPMLILTFLLEIIKIGGSYMIPYVCGLALIKDPAAQTALQGKWLNCLWSDAYVNMLTAIVPIPGGSGGAEYAFYLLYTNIFNDASITTAANILNRMITFYMPLFIGILVFFFYRQSPKEQVFKYDGTKTMVDLQIVRAKEALDKSDGLPSLRHVHIVGPDEKVSSTGTIQIQAPGKKKEENEDNSETLNNSNVKKKNRMHNRTEKKRNRRGKRLFGYDEENDDKILTSEEVAASFARLNQSSLFADQKVETEKSSVYDQSRNALKETFADIEEKDRELEEDRRSNEEIEEAIQADLARLREEQNRREEKRKEKERLQSLRNEEEKTDNNSEGKEKE